MRRSRWSRALAGRGTAVLAASALMAVMVVAPAGGTLAAPAGTAPAGHLPAWTIQDSPNATVFGGQLESVSCSSARACTAVGTSADRSGLSVMLADRWDGKSWQRQRMPDLALNTAPISAPDLVSVSCPASDFCEAVGGYQVSFVGISVAVRWNGRAWQLQRFPVPPASTSAGLNQVSCVSARFCEATGFYSNSIGENLPFTARWNGRSWRLQVTPTLVGATFVRLAGLSCVTSTFCEAAGNAAGVGAFAMRWDGATWHLQPVPANAGVGSISCTSATFCEMVGGGAGSIWNGSAWSAQTIPSPAGSTSPSLRGVSCPSAKFCLAVGEYSNNSGLEFTLGVRWDGASWVPQAPRNPGRVSTASLSAVACAAATACGAVGDFMRSSNNPEALAESWNGSSWHIQTGVATHVAAANDLSAVSCVSTVFCEAVGSYSDINHTSVALAEVWNGTSWQIQRVANPAQSSNSVRMILNGVSCVSVRFCEAVGTSSSSAGGGAEFWNGASWTLQAIPGGYLTSVSCTSVKFCMAAGGDGHVAIWNGTSWSDQATASGFTGLNSVSCVEGPVCEATGFGPAGDDAERWIGTSWSAQATPTPAGGGSPGLSGVFCTGAKSCEAVGGYSNSAFQPATLAEVWNGTAWRVQRTPNPAQSFGSSLTSVWCTSPTSCTAVGNYSIAVTSLTLAEVWNGTSWSLRSTPSNPSAGQNVLNGVSCRASHVCTAVGTTDDLAQIPATLIETGD